MGAVSGQSVSVICGTASAGMQVQWTDESEWSQNLFRSLAPWWWSALALLSPYAGRRAAQQENPSKLDHYCLGGDACPTSATDILCILCIISDFQM